MCVCLGVLVCGMGVRVYGCAGVWVYVSKYVSESVSMCLVCVCCACVCCVCVCVCVCKQVCRCSAQSRRPPYGRVHRHIYLLKSEHTYYVACGVCTSKGRRLTDSIVFSFESAAKVSEVSLKHPRQNFCVHAEALSGCEPDPLAHYDSSTAWRILHEDGSF